MKKYIVIATLIGAMLAMLFRQQVKIEDLRTERDNYKANTEYLMQDIKEYVTKDSLHAVSVGVLKLKLLEFQEYRKNDAELIKTLQIENRDLQSVTKAQLHTIAELKGTVRDSLIYLPGDTIVKTLRCIDIVDDWFELHGCSTSDNKFSGTYINRDSIYITNTVKRKRFLNFLWKTRKIEDRKIDAVCKNPSTKIIGLAYVEIEK